MMFCHRILNKRKISHVEPVHIMPEQCYICTLWNAGSHASYLSCIAFPLCSQNNCSFGMLWKWLWFHKVVWWHFKGMVGIHVILYTLQISSEFRVLHWSPRPSHSNNNDIGADLSFFLPRSKDKLPPLLCPPLPLLCLPFPSPPVFSPRVRIRRPKCSQGLHGSTVSSLNSALHPSGGHLIEYQLWLG